MTIGWGGVARLDLEPAGCGDPECDADHGYTGVMASDDFSLRVSAAADGGDAVAGLLSFAASLSARTQHWRAAWTRFVEPAYGRRSLADVVPAVARALGVRSGIAADRARAARRGVVRRVPGRRPRRPPARAARPRRAVPLGADGLLRRPRHGRRALDHRDQPDLARHRARPGRPRPGRLHRAGAGHRPAAQPPLLGPGRRPAGVAAAPDGVRTGSPPPA